MKVTIIFSALTILTSDQFVFFSDCTIGTFYSVDIAVIMIIITDHMKRHIVRNDNNTGHANFDNNDDGNNDDNKGEVQSGRRHKRKDLQIMTLWTSALRMKKRVEDNHNVYWSANNRNTGIWLRTGSAKILTDWRPSKMSFLTKGISEGKRIYKFGFKLFFAFPPYFLVSN